MKMRIIHLLSSTVFSGAENVACQIIDMFGNDEKYEMFYCSPNGDIENTLKEKNIKYIPIPKLRKNFLNKVLKEYKPDIIHAHDVKASIIASMFKKRCKIISHIHVNNGDMSKINLKTFLYQINSKNFDHIFWVSKSCFNGYIYNQKIKSKSSVLYNIINEQRVRELAFKKNIKYDYDICFLGRLVEQKDPLRTIKILREIIKNKENLKCAIIGEGELRKEVENKIKEYNLENNIKLLGYKNNPFEILKDSKILIMTSKFEGTPMCALEAMALGIPIVSTPIDGMNDIVDNNTTGILSNEDEILGKKILEIINDSEKYKKLSSNTINKSKEINDLNNYKKELIKVY